MRGYGKHSLSIILDCQRYFYNTGLTNAVYPSIITLYPRGVYADLSNEARFPFEASTESRYICT